MLKLRLKRIGKKKQPSYRLIIMENKTRRDGRSIDLVGSYDPGTKKFHLDAPKIVKWLKIGVKPTDTVLNLLKKENLIN